MGESQKLHEYRILRYGLDKSGKNCVWDIFGGRTWKTEIESFPSYEEIPELLEKLEKNGWEYVNLFYPERSYVSYGDLVVIVRRPKEE